MENEPMPPEVTDTDKLNLLHAFTENLFPGLRFASIIVFTGSCSCVSNMDIQDTKRLLRHWAKKGKE